MILHKVIINHHLPRFGSGGDVKTNVFFATGVNLSLVYHKQNLVIRYI